MNEERDIIINKETIKPLDQCSHDPGYLEGTDYSEWAVNSALLALDATCSENELNNALHLAATQEALISLSDKGLVDQFWDEKMGQVMFKLSDYGKTLVDSMPTSGT